MKTEQQMEITKLQEQLIRCQCAQNSKILTNQSVVLAAQRHIQKVEQRDDKLLHICPCCSFSRLLFADCQ